MYWYPIDAIHDTEACDSTEFHICNRICLFESFAMAEVILNPLGAKCQAAVRTAVNRIPFPVSDDNASDVVDNNVVKAKSPHLNLT